MAILTPKQAVQVQLACSEKSTEMRIVSALVSASVESMLPLPQGAFNYIVKALSLPRSESKTESIWRRIASTDR